MNKSVRPFFPALLLALSLAAGAAGIAQEPKAPAAPATPAAPTAPDTSPAAPAAAAPAADAATPPPADPDAPKKKEGELRTIDGTEPQPAEPAERSEAGESRSRRRGRVRVNSGHNSDRVAIGDNISLGKGETASEVVAIGGSATSDGEVSGSVVAIMGDARSTGPVGDSVVAVLGNVYVNNKVANEVVAILGNVELGPEAEVRDIVSIGGRVIRDPAAVVHGHTQALPISNIFGDAEWLRTWFTRCAMLGRPLAFGRHLGWAWAVAFGFLALYVLLGLLFRGGMEKCVTTLETRPGSSVVAAVLTVLLAPVAIILLVVTVVGVAVVPFAGAALFFAGLFGKATMLAWIGRRFTKFFGDGPLNHIAFAVLLGGLVVLLLYTVPVVGFLTYKLLGWLGLGVVVYTIVLGMKREKPPGPRKGGSTAPMPVAPAAAAAAPGASVAPSASAAMGATTAAFAGSPPPSVASSMAAAPLPATPLVPEPSPLMSSGFGASTPPASSVPVMPAAGAMAFTPEAPAAASVPPPVSAPPPPAPFPSPAVPVPAITLPRASLWIRLGALALDVILVAMIANFIVHLFPRIVRPDLTPPNFLPLLAIYGAIMWKLKGTTIGGIVCGVKVVRVDGRELDWATAIVRALGCFLSLAVAGLGFIWIAIDDERQSWHDKIAGTVVVRLPKGTPLV